ncbi:hypothetical protein F0562_011286 [Nyssa sinensis]|uniref:Uncharacterized protein n=1 Tax=Nyssa sinensis TaxID=561372 RepID=A0A5J5A1U6_9ASTE|nr:hypothetical protein F0562_011286 [Nyssa sinensis]
MFLSLESGGFELFYIERDNFTFAVISQLTDGFVFWILGHFIKFSKSGRPPGSRPLLLMVAHTEGDNA